jgi:hypothetical protein
MEYASLLAGERWSDAPSCTHPALAALARAVNDCTSDEARQQLAGLAPVLIHAHGSASGHGSSRQGYDQLGPRLARKAVLHALRVTTDVRRRTLLVALLGAEVACVPTARPDPDHEAVRVLLRDPDPDLRAAMRFVAGVHRPEAYNLRGVVTALHLAVRAIVDSAGPLADDALRELLVEAVDEARAAPVPEPAGGSSPS